LLLWHTTGIENSAGGSLADNEHHRSQCLVAAHVSAEPAIVPQRQSGRLYSGTGPGSTAAGCSSRGYAGWPAAQCRCGTAELFVAKHFESLWPGDGDEPAGR